MSHPFEIVAIDHVDITTPEDLEEEVVAWYTDCLGLERIYTLEGQRPTGAWFRVGDQELHVSRDEHNPPKKAHFGVVVDDFTAAVQRLRDAGCHIEQARPIAGRHRCYTRDPAGNRIEIVHLDEPRAVVAYEEVVPSVVELGDA